MSYNFPEIDSQMMKLTKLNDFALSSFYCGNIAAILTLWLYNNTHRTFEIVRIWPIGGTVSSTYRDQTGQTNIQHGREWARSKFLRINICWEGWARLQLEKTGPLSDDVRVIIKFSNKHNYYTFKRN